MNTDKWNELRAASERSYVTHIDLRDLAYLTEAALNLRMLVDAVRLLAEQITINDERQRFLDLIAGIEVLEGDLP